jgi:hypothetical protein
VFSSQSSKTDLVINPNVSDIPILSKDPKREKIRIGWGNGNQKSYPGAAQEARLSIDNGGATGGTSPIAPLPSWELTQGASVITRVRAEEIEQVEMPVCLASRRNEFEGPGWK